MTPWTEPRSTGSAADAVEDLFRAAHPTLGGWVKRLVDCHTAHEIASEAFLRRPSRIAD